MSKTRSLKTCILQLLPGKQFATRIVGTYFDLESKEEVHLLNNMIIKRGKLTNDETVWAYNFTKTNGQFIFQYDPKDDNYPGTVQRKFLLNHMSVLPRSFENLNARNPIFELVDNQILDEDLYSRIKQVNSVVNRVSGMSWEEQRNVCFSFGGNPVQMTKRELFLDLLHPEFGRLMFMDPNTEVNNAKLFLKIFGEQGNEDEVRINVMKAIALNIVVRKPGENGNTSYVVGGRTVGTSEDQVIAYFEANKELYVEAIRSAVEMRDHEQEPEDLDSIPTKSTDEKPKATKVEPTPEELALKAKVAKLKTLFTAFDKKTGELETLTVELKEKNVVPAESKAHVKLSEAIKGIENAIVEQAGSIEDGRAIVNHK